LRRNCSTQGERELFPCIEVGSTKMKVLPQYYNPDSELEWPTGNKQAYVTSKRTTWLKKKKDQNPDTKKSEITKEKKKTVTSNTKIRKTTNERNKNNTDNNDNDKINNLQNKHYLNKTTFDSTILDNPYITDKKLFENWYKKVYKKTHIDPIKPTSTLTSNYYNCIDLTSDTYNKDNTKASSINRINYISNNKPSNDNYKNKQNTIANKRTMPLLQTKSYTTPDFDTSNNDEPHDNTKVDNDDDWIMTNQKEFDREKKATTEYFSNIYLPRYLPNVVNNTDTIRHTTIVLPLSIKVLPNKDRRAKFRQSRIIYAVLGAMQKVFKETYLGPIEDDPTITLINNLDEIPLEMNNIKEYLATPIQPKQSLFLGKIYIHTNHYLQEYQANEIFTDYLRKENIIIEINDLDDVNPVQLGFVENIIPRNDTIQMHQNRLNALMPNNAPKFQLCISSLWGKTGERCKVVMIKCDDINKEGFLQTFEKLNDEKILSFFPMTDYTSGCSQEQKTTIIKRINTRMAHYRSILIGGFCDNDDNVPMVFNDENQNNNILTTTGVTEYLSKCIKNSNGDNLFHHVYPPQNGMREVVVKLINFSQAISFRKVAHGELARNMDAASIEKVFLDPIQADLDSVKDPWKPNGRVMNVIPTPTTNSNEYKAKRQRQDPNDHFPIKTIKASYSSITAGTNITAMTSKTTQNEIDIEKLVQQSVEGKLKILQETFNNNKTETDNKINKLHNTITETAEHTNISLKNIQGTVDFQINEIKNEVSSTKTEMVEIKTTLATNTDLLLTLLAKMDNVSVTNNKQIEPKALDVEMSESKQQNGLRVTRSQTMKK
jgi:hypothetical protein